MRKTIFCEFRDDGRVEVINVDDIAIWVGRGIWGKAHIQDLAERDHMVYCDCKIVHSGEVALGSSQRQVMLSDVCYFVACGYQRHDAVGMGITPSNVDDLIPLLNEHPGIEHAFHVDHKELMVKFSEDGDPKDFQAQEEDVEKMIRSFALGKKSMPKKEARKALMKFLKGIADEARFIEEDFKRGDGWKDFTIYGSTLATDDEDTTFADLLMRAF